VELFKLDITRQERHSGVLGFLSSMFDSIDTSVDNSQKVDPQVFENFAGHAVKIAGKVNGNTVEFDQVEPLVVAILYIAGISPVRCRDKLTGR